MVDVSAKKDMCRKAVATGFIKLQQNAIEAVKKNELRKGDVLSTARIAGIQAAKQTGTTIPLCHNLTLEKVTIDFVFEPDGIRVISMAKCTGKTGVEMEALTGASVALLTIYDMCKAIDKEMTISEICLKEKTKKELQ